MYLFYLPLPCSFLTAALSAFATFSLLSLYHARSRRSCHADLADHISRTLASAATETRIQQPSPSLPLPIEPELEPEPEYAEELVCERLARNYAFLHEDGVARMRAASVVTSGLRLPRLSSAHSLITQSLFLIRICVLGHQAHFCRLYKIIILNGLNIYDIFMHLY